MNLPLAVAYAWFWKPLLDLMAFCLLLEASA